MKSKQRRTRITIETRRLRVMTGLDRKAWCAGCDQEVVMITIEQAATLARMSAMQIYRSIHAGKLHYAETEEGSLLVCVNSIGRLT